jgi:hypothetical protein
VPSAFLFAVCQCRDFSHVFCRTGAPSLCARSLCRSSTRKGAAIAWFRLFHGIARSGPRRSRCFIVCYRAVERKLSSSLDSRTPRSYRARAVATNHDTVWLGFQSVVFFFLNRHRSWPRQVNINKIPCWW